MSISHELKIIDTVSDKVLDLEDCLVSVGIVIEVTDSVTGVMCPWKGEYICGDPDPDNFEILADLADDAARIAWIKALIETDTKFMTTSNAVALVKLNKAIAKLSPFLGSISIASD